jgi:hypothetical protein
MKFSDWTNTINSLDTGIEGVTYSDFVRELFRPLPKAAMLTHAALGMFTEYDEARKATSSLNFLEECGDYLFFFIAATQQLEFEDFEVSEMEAICETMEKDALALGTRYGEMTPNDLAVDIFAQVLDMAKRWLAYDKAPDAAASKRFVMLSMLGMGLLHGANREVTDIPPSELVKSNVAKLRHRYKGGFSTAAAVNRNVEGEMNAVVSATSGS